MASRAKAKEEARERRLAEEQARAAEASRRRRLQMLSGAVLAAIIVVGVAIAISAGGSGGGLQKGRTQAKTVTAVSTLLAGIPQSGATLGSPSAPVTMTYYGDLECPICKDFTLAGGFPQLVANEVKQGKVKVVYKGFETATRSPTTFQTQQVAALAAGQQNRFWNFVELFYHEQGSETTDYVNEAYLDGLAHQVPGLNFTTWKTQRSNPTLVSQVATDEQAGNSAGIQGTPTLIFTGPTGKKAQPSTSVPSYSDLQNTIKLVS